MRRLGPLFLLLTACASAPGFQEGEINPMPPEVQRVHTRMLWAMGGPRAWAQARYFEFDFSSVRAGDSATPPRRHRWDRRTGDYRLEEVRDGDTLLAIGNLNTLQGRVWLNGAEVLGARRDTLFSTAYVRFFNDSYVLLMPFKWADPGVHTHYLGVHNDDQGTQWEIVKLTFDLVGITPQYEYLAYINPRTGLMERWYQFTEAGATPVIHNWVNWTQFGPIKLATERQLPDGSGRVQFTNVKVDTKVPDDAFKPPEPRTRAR